MDRQIEGSAVTALKKAALFLSKWLNWKNRVVIIFIGLLSILVGFYMLWVEKQTGTLRFWGYVSFFVILMFFVYAIPVFTRIYYKWVTSKYEKMFKSYPPLLGTLFTFTPDSPFSIQRLLINRSPIVLGAFHNEGILIDEQKHVLISLGLEHTHSVFLRLSTLFEYTNTCLRRIPENISTGNNVVWSTGEFGMLRDQGFLESLEQMPKGNSATIIGYVEGRPSQLDKVLKILSEMAEKDIKEDKETKDRDIGPRKQKQIRRLIKNKKLFIHVTPTRLEEPHLAVLGEYIWIQQQHKHSDKNKAVCLIKNPSESLKGFVNNYLEECRTVAPLTIFE